MRRVSYVVLARKYRPQTFEDLVGQGHVTRTLQNALTSGRIAHAYLFTGARGVGKTTSARILARALNCQSQQGPTPEPCGKCSACTEIAAGTDLDVLEMDAASRTGVDDIRELQKSLAYVPSRDRFKVYIVDEVHMLSVSAFNAFLKTLEEPPAHVKFIFATTEPHKVPVTVLSRCQRYDFRLIDTDVIRGALDSILAREKIEMDPVAVALVAREAAGSMRDALSLLDQVVAFGGDVGTGGAIDAVEVARVLGIADRKQLFDLGAALVDRDPRRALETVAEVAQSGHDLVHFSREVLTHLRNLVVVKLAPDPGRLVDSPDAERKGLAEQAAPRSLVDLERLFLGFSRAFEEIATSATPRLLLEMAVVRLAHEQPLLPVDDLLGRLEGLERRLAGGPAADPRPASGGRPAPVRSVSAAPAAAAEPRSAVAVTSAPGPRLVVPEPSRAPAPAPAVTPAPAATAAHAPAVIAAHAGTVLEEWRAILDLLGQDNKVLRGVLEHAVPVAVSVDGVQVTLPPESLHGRIATGRDNVEALRRVVERHYGRAVPVAVSLSRPDASAAKSSSEVRAEELSRVREGRVKAAEALPSVRAAVSVFGGAVKSMKTELE